MTLTIICLITASLLTGVYLLARPKILAQKAQAEKEALEEVIPEAKCFEPVIRDREVTYFRAYSSVDKRKILGYAFRAEAQGYSSIIETMAGVDSQGKITGIKILAQNETPGLGAKINEIVAEKTLWQAIKALVVREKKVPDVSGQPWFCEQFKDKKIKDLIVVKAATKKNIQAITGATISSKAITDSVREKVKEILRYEQ